MTEEASQLAAQVATLTSLTAQLTDTVSNLAEVSVATRDAHHALLLALVSELKADGLDSQQLRVKFFDIAINTADDFDGARRQAYLDTVRNLGALLEALD